MFRKMPMILLAIILLILSVDRFIPIYLKQFAYSLSLSVKSILIFMLLFKTISQLSRTATKMIFFLLVALCFSNFLSTMISSQIGSIIYQFDLCIKIPTDQAALMPIWSFTLPKWMANDHAMFAGIFFSFFKPMLGLKISLYFEKAIQRILHLLTFVIPIFIFGFIIKPIHDQLNYL